MRLAITLTTAALTPSIRHLAGHLSRPATRKYQAPRCQGVHRAQDVHFQAKCNLMEGGFHVVLPFFPVKQSSGMGWNGFLACGCTPNHGLKLWNLGKVPKNHRKLPQNLGKFTLHSLMFSPKKPCFRSNERPWERNPGGMPKTSPARPQNHGIRREIEGVRPASRRMPEKHLQLDLPSPWSLRPGSCIRRSTSLIRTHSSLFQNPGLLGNISGLFEQQGQRTVSDTWLT